MYAAVTATNTSLRLRDDMRGLIAFSTVIGLPPLYLRMRRARAQLPTIPHRREFGRCRACAVLPASYVFVVAWRPERGSLARQGARP